MTNVFDLSRNFCYNNNREVKARMSGRTKRAMATELQLPQHYVELDEQEMMYVDGGSTVEKWGWFGLGKTFYLSYKESQDLATALTVIGTVEAVCAVAAGCIPGGQGLAIFCGIVSALAGLFAELVTNYRTNNGIVIRTYAGIFTGMWGR